MAQPAEYKGGLPLPQMTTIVTDLVKMIGWDNPLNFAELSAVIEEYLPNSAVPQDQWLSVEGAFLHMCFDHADFFMAFYHTRVTYGVLAGERTVSFSEYNFEQPA